MHLDFLKIRGYIKDIINEQTLEIKLQKGEIVAYCGFDLTAQSLHIGHLMPLMLLRYLYKIGNKIIIIFGGATTKIGDPSDKNEMRKMLSDEEIEENKQEILHNSIGKFININDKKNVIIVNNNDWFKDKKYIEFLREIGTHFTINKMINMEFVKRRLENENPLTFLEFNYMIMQGYDFYHLNKEFRCNMQIGGSEQWGNIIQGIELIRRKQEIQKIEKQQEIYGITIPLVLKSDGTKMGKTSGGAVWLNEKMLEPFEYFQYFRNTADHDVIKFLKLFTELPDEEINKFSDLKYQELNAVKDILAFETTKLCHGEEKAKEMLAQSRKLFQKNNNFNIDEIDENSVIKINKNNTLINVLMQLQLVKSNSDARKLIEAGAVKINNEKITDKHYIFKNSNKIILSIGKNTKKILEIV